MENNSEDYELKSMCSTELENLVNSMGSLHFHWQLEASKSCARRGAFIQLSLAWRI